MRMIIGTIAGILLAFGLVFLAQQVGGSLSPLVYDPATEEAEASLVSTLILFGGWFFATFAGAWVAMRTTTNHGPGWVVAGAVAGAGIIQTIRTGDAVWVVAAAFLLPLAAAWLSAHAVRNVG